MKNKTTTEQLVCCKNCRFYHHQVVNKYSEIHECVKENTVNLTGYDIKANKPCFQPKRFKGFWKKNK